MNERLLNVAGHEMKQTLKRRSYLLIAFGLPVLALVAALVIVTLRRNDSNEPDDPLSELAGKKVGYVDESGLFPDPGPFAVVLGRYDSQAAGLAAAEAGEIQSLFVIPADYLSSGKVTRYARQLNIIQDDMSLMDQFLRLSLAGEIDPRLLLRLDAPANIVVHQLDASGAELSALEQENDNLFWLVYLFALVMMLTSFLTAGQLMQSVITEKENRVIEVVLLAVKPFQLLAGKLLGHGAMGLLMVVAWLGTVYLLTKIGGIAIPFLGAAEIPPRLLALAIPYFLGGFALYGAFAAAIGAISVNNKEGPQYAAVYSLPAALPFFFLARITEDPNGPVAVALSLFPLSSPNGMIMRLVLTDVPAWQLGLSLALLFLGALGGLWLAARLFRVQSLLAGRLPRPREVLALLARG